MDARKLTDRELAALMYGMERFCDGMYENGYTVEFLNIANALGAALGKEYRKRKLNYKQFTSEGT